MLKVSLPFGEISSFSTKAKQELLHLPLELIVDFHTVTPHGQTQYYRHRKRGDGPEGIIKSLAGLTSCDPRLLSAAEIGM